MHLMHVMPHLVHPRHAPQLVLMWYQCANLQVWEEYDEGINGKKPLRLLEEETKGEWRTGYHRQWNQRMTLINVIKETATLRGWSNKDAALSWANRQQPPEKLTLNQIYETATQLKSAHTQEYKLWLSGRPAWDVGLSLGGKLTCASFKHPDARKGGSKGDGAGREAGAAAGGGAAGATAAAAAGGPAADAAGGEAGAPAGSGPGAVAAGNAAGVASAVGGAGAVAGRGAAGGRPHARRQLLASLEPQAQTHKPQAPTSRKRRAPDRAAPARPATRVVVLPVMVMGQQPLQTPMQPSQQPAPAQPGSAGVAGGHAEEQPEQRPPTAAELLGAQRARRLQQLQSNRPAARMEAQGEETDVEDVELEIEQSPPMGGTPQRARTTATPGVASVSPVQPRAVPVRACAPSTLALAGSSGASTSGAAPLPPLLSGTVISTSMLSRLAQQIEEGIARQAADQAEAEKQAVGRRRPNNPYMLFCATLKGRADLKGLSTSEANKVKSTLWHNLSREAREKFQLSYQERMKAYEAGKESV